MPAQSYLINHRSLAGSIAVHPLRLSNNQSFQQIASDGGLLNEPIELTELQVTPGERAEIIVDFSNMIENEDIKLITDDGTNYG